MPCPGPWSRRRNRRWTKKYLEFSKVHKIYPTPKGPLTVVEDFDLKLRKGEFISLIGHSGCGKSTALTMVAFAANSILNRMALAGGHIGASDFGTIRLFAGAVMLAALQETQAEQQRKRAYVERIADPSLPDYPAEPRRIRSILATFILGLLAWGVLSMLIVGVREHRD